MFLFLSYSALFFPRSVPVSGYFLSCIYHGICPSLPVVPFLCCDTPVTVPIPANLPTVPARAVCGRGTDMEIISSDPESASKDLV